ncbi:MAG TPA: ABC transporter permease [Natrialbaceae archaeon]|nr:ABC transporter permease [Natrialbaceae archaeon]
MNSRSYLLRRLAWSIVVVWIILTLTFFLFVVIPDPNKPWVLPQDPGGREKAEALTSQYFQQMHYDEPLLQRYLHWMKMYVTLQWGQSFVQQRPVLSILGEATPVTLAYLLPATALAYLLGTVQGLYSAMDRFGPLKRLGNAVVYTGLGLPAFFVGEMAFFLALDHQLPVSYDSELSVLSAHNLGALVIPTLVLALNLGAVYARYTRAETSGYLSRDFVKKIRASGGRSRDVARHALRNAMPPLLSLFFSRVLTVLFLSIFVIEVVFGLPGLGRVTLHAIEERDVAVILAMTFITVLVGVLGNLLQDVAYAVIDPRIGSDEG